MAPASPVDERPGRRVGRLPYVHSVLRRASRSARRSRVIAYSSVVLVVVALVALGPLAAPCSDWMEGSCESNWASDAQWLLLAVLLVALLVVVCFAVRDSLATLRRLRETR